MRTTVNIDDALLAEAKLRAAREGRKLGAVISDALREDLARRRSRKGTGKSQPVVTFRGTGVRPGVHLDSMAELLDIMDGTP